jgi:hypothetical protein
VYLLGCLKYYKIERVGLQGNSRSYALWDSGFEKSFFSLF